ncbi:MAG: ATP-binding protein [Synergistaceae bacterium]|nr:ATP-binding protein [Synergistaceae bacterium]
MNDNGRDVVLDAIFSSVFDQVTIYRIVKNKNGDPIDFILESANEAYIQTNNLRREEVIGKKYSEIWANEKEKGFWNLMLRVARAGEGRHGAEQRRLRSNYFEGISSSVPGIYYQTFAFVPCPGKLAVILKDMSEWYHLTYSLKEKERLLLKYREDLRNLTAKLTLAEEKTRRSIATVLHDRIGYSMVSMARSIRGLYERFTEDPARREIYEVITEMEKLIKDVRSFTFEISPTLLYEVGLEAALETLGEDMFLKNNVKFSISVSGIESKAPEDTNILLFQMVRELFVNIVKHAKASEVKVTVRRGTKKYQIIVEDDGVGFNIENRKDFRGFSGVGLFSIRERLTSVGGQLNIVSTHNEGTIASIIVPLSESKIADSAPLPAGGPKAFLPESHADELRIERLRGGRRAF